MNEEAYKEYGDFRLLDIKCAEPYLWDHKDATHIRVSMPPSKKNYKKMIDAVVENIDKDSTVLEIAAGTGEISMNAAAKAKQVVCTDISENMLKVANK
jgi:2-polyprenyl-3-methyl-5-hydroxy-6-metoxy-1,4-benzoquinol methylase